MKFLRFLKEGKKDLYWSAVFLKPKEVADWKVVLFLFFYSLTILVYILCFALAKLDGCYLNSNVLGYLNACFLDSGSTEPIRDCRSDCGRTTAHNHSLLEQMLSAALDYQLLVLRYCVRLVPFVYRPFGLRLSLMFRVPYHWTASLFAFIELTNAWSLSERAPLQSPNICFS